MAVRADLMTFYHGTSTASMGGKENRNAAVDEGGRVWRVEGLRAVDASIFPEAISTPTNLTTIMVAERIAATFA